MTEQDPNRPRVEPSLGSAAAPTESAPRAAQRASDAPGWERATIERVLMAAVVEQRRARRWRIFFRFAGVAVALLFLGVALGLIRPPQTASVGRHTAVVEIEGVLEPGGESDAESVMASLRAAFKDASTAGVVLRINSPGGSPVQAGLIADEIRRLRGLHPNVPLYAVVEEICASGGYYVAAAADRIYVDKASLVGSIGVTMGGFGFTEAMGKLGVERRLLTAGENKDFLDPFSPLAEAQREHATKMLAIIHQQFIDTVRKGRGERLKDSPDLYSGLIWTGATSVELGLADGLGSVRSVARDVVKAEDLVDFTRRPNIAERLAKRAGVAAGQVIARELGIAADAPRLR